MAVALFSWARARVSSKRCACPSERVGGWPSSIGGKISASQSSTPSTKRHLKSGFADGCGWFKIQKSSSARPWTSSSFKSSTSSVYMYRRNQYMVTKSAQGMRRIRYGLRHASRVRPRLPWVSCNAPSLNCESIIVAKKSLRSRRMDEWAHNTRSRTNTGGYASGSDASSKSGMGVPTGHG